MSPVKASDVFTRHPLNPIITVDDLPYRANSVFNPGVGMVNGETLLLIRVEDLRGISHLLAARSTDGVSGWRFDQTPLIAPEPDKHPEEIWGCEDPRLTWLPEQDQWAIAYTAYSRRGPLVSLAMSRDFTSVRKLGPVMPPEDKDAALFPRRIDGADPHDRRVAAAHGAAGVLDMIIEAQFVGLVAAHEEQRRRPCGERRRNRRRHDAVFLEGRFHRRH